MRNAVWLLGCWATLFCSSVDGQQGATWKNLGPCDKTSMELGETTGEVDACVLYDVRANTSAFTKSELDNKIVEELVIIQATPSIKNCRDHRDGLLTSVLKLNSDNGGKGVAIGFNKDKYVQFRLTSVVVGNSANMTGSYGALHEKLLGEMAQDPDLGAHYIAGSCSFASSFDSQVAKDESLILMAQVGPPSYYEASTNPSYSPYIFGIHVSSDTYSAPFLRQLKLQDNPPSVSIISRTKSGFFNSTCKAALDFAENEGLAVDSAQFYDPDEDSDNNGEDNSVDVSFLKQVATNACSGPHERRAIVACVLTSEEADTLLATWRELGCVPEGIWYTSALWAWGLDHPEETKYMVGAGQWHPNFPYSDRYFASGVELQNYNQAKFGYTPSYDTVASYTIAQVFASHVQDMFRIENNPKVLRKFADDYEAVRRQLLILRTETIFGTVSFSSTQRNHGRGPASSQYLPVSLLSASSSSSEPVFKDTCISPEEAQEALAVLPVPGAVDCDAGSYKSSAKAAQDKCLSCSKCDFCPSGTFTSSSGASECKVCVAPKTSIAEQGSIGCLEMESNLIPHSTLSFGYAFVAIVWVFALGLIAWIWIFRKDPVVRIGQPIFLTLMCCGAMISSATIFALSFQAGPGEDTTAATIGCKAAPFLYVTGWALQYGSIGAKTWRMYKIFVNPKLVKSSISPWSMVRAIFLLLLVQWAVVALWLVLNPLYYGREVGEEVIQVSTSTLTISSVGYCQADHSIWPYVGFIIFFQICLMSSCNLLLYKLRRLHSRYQERKYITFATVFTSELFILGVPIIVLLDNEPTARFVIITIVIAFSDFGALAFVFLPKINYQRVGLPEGLSVMESLTNVRPSSVKSNNYESNHTGNTGNTGNTAYTAYTARDDLQEAGNLSDSPTYRDSSNSTVENQEKLENSEKPGNIIEESSDTSLKTGNGDLSQV